MRDKTRDPRVEQILEKEGASWLLVEDVPLSAINRVASRENQARFEPENKDHVVDLAIALASGDILPAPVGYITRDTAPIHWTPSSIILMSGNHRDAAFLMANNEFECSFTKADMYIALDPGRWLIDVLTRTLNFPELPIDRTQRIEHAKYLIRTHGIAYTEAEKRLKLKEGTLNRYLQQDTTMNRLATLGFKKSLPLKHASDISGIQSDKALLETAKLINDAKLRATEVPEVARRVKAASSSEKQQLNEIEKIRSEYQDRITHVKRGDTIRTMSNETRYRTGLSYVKLTRPESVKPLSNQLKRSTREAYKHLEEILA